MKKKKNKIPKFLKKRFFLKKNNRSKISIFQRSEYNKIKIFSKNQVIRYGYYRQSDLRKEKIKKIIIDVNPFLKNINSSDPLFISIKGITKLFLGEVIEISKQIMFQTNDTVQWFENPIQPFHIKEALRRYFLIN